MNQKVKKVFVTALCCSLLISSLNGISAVAETMAAPDVQGEDHQTAVPSEGVQGRASASFPEADTEAGVPPADEELPEQTEQVVGQAETPETSPIPVNTPESLRAQRAVQTVDIPEKTYKMSFLDESGRFIDPAKVSITGDIMKFTMQGALTKVGAVATNNVGTTKQMTVPKVALSGDTATESYEFSGIQNEKITLPRFYNVPKVTPSANYTGQVYPMAVTKQLSLTGEVSNEETTGARLNMFESSTPNQFIFSRSKWTNDPAENMFARGFNMATAGGTPAYLTTDDHIYYYVPNKRVNIYYNDMTPNGLPAYPTGYNATLSKTVIDSENFHYKAPIAFPEFFSSGNRHFQFKGWYKGASRPADPKAVKLETSLTPEFDVTYDGADNLYIFYDEVQEMTSIFPEVKYNFGFVDEKGALISPTNVEIQTNLTTVVNETAQNVGTATGVNVDNLKQLTVPSQTLTYVPKFKQASSGTTNFRLTLPKRYKTPTVTPGSFYTGSTTAYPVATTMLRYVNGNADERIITDGSRYRLYNSTTPHSYQMFGSYWEQDSTKTVFSAALSMATTEAQSTYFTTDDTMYYYLENRRITEHFVDDSGAEITPPTGFTQGKKTIIDRDDFTYTSNQALPSIYKTEDKTYQLKGWYKGKIKPTTLKESETPSYPVTYDDQDDLTVVYEEIAQVQESELRFGFVDEEGNLLDPKDFEVTSTLTYDFMDEITVPVPLTAEDITDYKVLKTPAKDFIKTDHESFYGLSDTKIRIPKYYKGITSEAPALLENKYPVAKINRINLQTGRMQESLAPNAMYYDTNVNNGNNTWTLLQSPLADSEGEKVFSVISHAAIRKKGDSEYSYQATVDLPLFYYVTNRRVTEHFVDDSGTEITPPNGFTQGNQLIMDSEDYTYTSAKALPRTYQAGAKTYVFQGWFKGKNKPATLKTTMTPSFTPTFDDDDDMTAVYQEAIPTAELALTGAVEVIENDATMDHWEVLLKNTGEAPLTTIKIKPTATWVAGISAPNAVAVQGTGQNTKDIPVKKEQWATDAGVTITLDQPLPAGGQLKMNLLGTTVTGKPGQVLTAEVSVTGNFGSLTAKDTVRIKDLDQEVTSPDGDGFISTPTFDFGKLPISGSKQQYGLKKAADYYSNGTRNPFLRLNTSQDNWSLTAQLSQPKSVADSLPTTTRLLLGTADATSFADYNQPTESSTPIGKTSTVTLTADNTATSVVANQQFTGSDVYQLDFMFDNIKLEVPANQGMASQQYQAAVTWNLVTGP
ncbi:TPA: WxL domain-containing protein [Enterococcus faecalis]